MKKKTNHMSKIKPNKGIDEANFSEKNFEIEMGLAMFGTGMLGFEEACKLSGLDTQSFLDKLAERHIPRPFSPEELEKKKLDNR